MHHAFFGEVLGAGGFYSANYEVALGALGFRLGIGSIGSFRPYKAVVSVPLGISFIGVGSNPSRFEVGATASLFLPRATCTPISDDFCNHDRIVVHPGLLAGYRYQSWDNGFFFRAGMGFFAGFDSGSGDEVFGIGEGGAALVLWPYLALGGTV